VTRWNELSSAAPPKRPSILDAVNRNGTVEVEVDSINQRYCGRGPPGDMGRGADPVVAGEDVPAERAGDL
jgi:hypothetical protein